MDLSFVAFLFTCGQMTLSLKVKSKNNSRYTAEDRHSQGV